MASTVNTDGTANMASTESTRATAEAMATAILRKMNDRQKRQRDSSAVCCVYDLPVYVLCFSDAGHLNDTGMISC